MSLGIISKNSFGILYILWTQYNPTPLKLACFYLNPMINFKEKTSELEV